MKSFNLKFFIFITLIFAVFAILIGVVIYSNISNEDYRDVVITLYSSIISSVSTIAAAIITIFVSMKQDRRKNEINLIPELFCPARYDIIKAIRLNLTKGKVPNHKIYIKNTEKASFRIFAVTVVTENGIINDEAKIFIDKGDLFCFEFYSNNAFIRLVIIIETTIRKKYRLEIRELENGGYDVSYRN